MRTDLQTITPEMARQFLTANYSENRRFRKRWAEFLASQISAGAWKVTHQGIAFNKTGELIDGQHRLAAIVLAGQPVTMNVTRGLSSDVFLVLDQGNKRSLGEATNMHSRDVAAIRLALAVMRVRGMNQNFPASEIEAGKAWFKPHLDRITSVCPDIVKTRTAAPIRFAVAVRIGIGQYEYVMDQYTAFVRMDFDRQNPAPQSLFKKLTRGTLSARMDPGELAVNAWNAFDPARKDIPLGGIRNMEHNISDIREALAVIYEMAT